MAKTDSKTVDEHIATFPAAMQKTLKTVRFPLDQPVPVKLIADMPKYRAKDNLNREQRRAKP